MQTIQSYQLIPYEDITESEYQELCGRFNAGSTAYPIPYIGDIIQETWYSSNLDFRDKRIREALERRDHELYGMSVHEFQENAYHGHIKGLELTLEAKEVHYAVFQYLMSRRMSFLHYDQTVVHSPLGSGIW